MIPSVMLPAAPAIKVKRNKPKDDEDFIPPEFETPDDDLDEVINSQYSSKKKKGKKKKVLGRRKLRDFFNLSTFAGQLYWILREEDSWMTESRIREKLFQKYKSKEFVDYGFRLQISTQLGQFWGKKRVNRKGFPGSFEYKLFGELRDSKLSKKKKRKLGEHAAERSDRDSSPPKTLLKKCENTIEILTYVLRKGRFMKLQEIYEEYVRLSHQRDVNVNGNPFRRIEKVLDEEQCFEKKKKKGKKKDSEYRIVNMPEPSLPSQEFLIPLPPPQVEEPTIVEPPKIILSFACPLENSENIRSMNVYQYVSSLFDINLDKRIDISEVYSHLRKLKASNLVEGKSLRSDLTNAMEELVKDPKIFKLNSKRSNLYLKMTNVPVQSPPLPPPPPVQRQQRRRKKKVVKQLARFPISGLRSMDSYLGSITKIIHGRLIGENESKKGGAKETIMKTYIESNVHDEDDDDDDSGDSCPRRITNQSIVAVYNSHEPFMDYYLNMVRFSRSQTQYHFIKMIYCGKLNERFRDDLQQRDPNPLFVIYENKPHAFKDLMTPEFCSPKNVFQFIMLYIDMILSFRNSGLLVSPNMNNLFFDRSVDDGICNVQTIVPLACCNSGELKDIRFTFVDIETSGEEVDEFPSEFIRDVRKKLIHLCCDFLVVKVNKKRNAEVDQEIKLIKEVAEIVKKMGSRTRCNTNHIGFMGLRRFKEMIKKKIISSGI